MEIVEQQYSSYKPSGFDWMGDIPEHWEVKKLKYMPLEQPLSFIDGDWIESKDIVFEESIRYITTGNIGEGKYKEQGHSFITQETFDALNCTEVFPGDLLISRLNNPIGRSCVMPDLGYRVVTSVDNVIFRPKDDYDKKYLNFLMNNTKYYEYTELIARGATMQRISRGLLAEIKLCVPPTKEQKFIARFLSEKTAEINQSISDKEKLISLYEEEARTLINEAVTKGLDPNAPLKPSGIDWLGEIPENWEVKKLKYLAKIATGKTPPTSNEAYFLTEDYDWYTPGDFTGEMNLNPSTKKISQSAVDDEGLKLFEADAVLLVSIGATLGKVGISKSRCFSNQQINAILFYGDKMIPLFGAYFLESYSSIVAGQAVASTLAILNQEKTKDLLITWPPIAEQREIVEFIQSASEEARQRITLIHQEIKLLKEYIQALIFEAVTGKIKIYN